MKILIAGCGYLGRALGAQCAAEGWAVWGLCRSSASVQKIRTAGFEPLQADLTDPSSLHALPSVDAVVACQAPARGENYESTYFQATDNLLRALKSKGAAAPTRRVFVSSTSVYGPRAGAWVDADTPIDPSTLDADAKILRRTEELLLSDESKGMVVRLSGIYGPGRSRVDSIRSGRVKSEASSAYTNRIHLEDAVRAILCVLKLGEPGQVYLASDDRPATQTEFYEWLCPKLGVPLKPAPDVAPANESKRCSNAKLKQLGWKPHYPSYIEGYGELLA